MGKWKDSFLRSLDPEYERPESFEFGPPATDADLAALSSAVAAELPKDLVELLREFNGIQRICDGWREPYNFNTQTMLTAGEYYRDWDCDTKFVMTSFAISP